METGRERDKEIKVVDVWCVEKENFFLLKSSSLI